MEYLLIGIAIVWVVCFVIMGYTVVKHGLPKSAMPIGTQNPHGWYYTPEWSGQTWKEYNARQRAGTGATRGKYTT